MSRFSKNGLNPAFWLIGFIVVTGISLNAQSPATTTSLPLMPWPSNVTGQAGWLEIDTNFSASLSGAGASDARVKDAVQRVFPRLARQTGIPIAPHIAAGGGTATLTIIVEERDHRPPQRLGDNERYALEVSGGHAKISADAPLGAIRGIETFLQLVQQNTSVTGGTPSAAGFSIPDLTIRDEPRFAWRGLSLDSSRHFIPVEGIKRTLDGMAAVKLNVFHWHLSDDQGFRMESKKYPRLQQYGSDAMYYTQAEVRELIAYAANRGIRIVPEFDMPGHATSWLPGYPKLGSGPGPYQVVHAPGIHSALLDPTKDYTYRFLEGFISEMSKLFPDEYFHIGGDEVDPKEWNESPHIQAFMKKHGFSDAAALQAYFNQRLLKILSKHGKHMVGWDEVLHPDLPKSVVIQSWRGQKSLAQAAREGYQGILSAGYYLDLMQPASQHYAVDPMKGETADLTDDQKKRILGGEAAMWEELATAENLDAKLWPRLAAIAERLWSPESMTDSASMYVRLAAVNHWLEWLGLTQRSNLELMRQRLTGADSAASLDSFSSVLEPVKEYERHAENYTILTPLNRLVDSIAPESDPARNFRDAVDHYLSNSKSAADAEALRKQLQDWSDSARIAHPILEKNSLLTEDIPAADSLVTLCRVGQEALSSLSSDAKLEPDWKQKSLAAIADAAKPHAFMLIQIAPAIQKLVEAARIRE